MWVKILLLFFVFSFLFRTDHSFDQDLGRHLKLGEIIWQTKEFPKTNFFSYTNPNFPFINTHWLFEVLAYFFQQAGVLQLLLMIKIIIIITSVWLVIKVIPKENSALLLPIGFIFLHVLRERIELRPEIFSFLFTASSFYILEKYLRESIKLIFLLPFIQLIWINTHIYFFVGLALQAIFLVHTLGVKLTHPKGVQNRHLGVLGMIFFLSISASLLNPHRLEGMLYPLNVTKNYGYTIVENQTMFLLESINFKDPNFLFVKISIGIILLSIFFVILNTVKNLKTKSRDSSLIALNDNVAKNILLSLTGLGLALLNVRSFPYLVFLSLPATLQSFGTIRWNGFTQMLTIAAGFLLIVESFFYLNGDYYKYKDGQHRVGFGFEESVKGAADFIVNNDLPQPIYNNFDIGSYLLYRGYPRYHVFVDGRPEAYPAQFFTGVYIPSQSDYKNFKEVEKVYGLKSIIFSHTDQTPWGRNFLQNIVKDEGWKLVYFDDFSLVFTRFDVTGSKGLNHIKLETLSPNTYKFDNYVSYLRMGIFLLNTGFTESGRQFVEKAISIFPDSPIANAILGNPEKSKTFFFW